MKFVDNNSIKRYSERPEVPGFASILAFVFDSSRIRTKHHPKISAIRFLWGFSPHSEVPLHPANRVVHYLTLILTWALLPAISATLRIVEWVGNAPTLMVISC